MKTYKRTLTEFQIKENNAGFLKRMTTLWYENQKTKPQAMKNSQAMLFLLDF